MDQAAALKRLLDLEAIRDLNARYNHAFDNRQGELFASFWTEDCFGQRKNSEPKMKGRAAMAASAENWPVDGRHISTEAVIQLDGDSATQTIYCLFLDMAPPCEVSMFGIYEDKLVRTSEGWKFSERIFEPLYLRPSDVKIKMRESEPAQ
jgi:hypothetical protein